MALSDVRCASRSPHWRRACFGTCLAGVVTCAACGRRWIGGGLKPRVRGGLAYEKGAFASSALTPLTLDSDKVVLSGGLSIQLHRRLRFDTVLGYVFMKDMKVRDSKIEQPGAIRPSTDGFATTLGNGDYKMDALFLGGGFCIEL